MGEVYKARDTRLDRIVAVKAVKQEFTERFEREARASGGAESSPHLPVIRRRPELFGDGVTLRARR